MKEILYRQLIKSSKTKINGTFHYWGYMVDGFIGPMGKNESVGDSEQFTGLKDKNGVKIFEGDLIEVRGNTNGCLQVEFINDYVGGWVLTHPDVDGHVSLGARACDDIEVIGNVHENPGLLS